MANSPDRRPARRRCAGRSLFPRYAPRVHRQPARPQRPADRSLNRSRSRPVT